MSSLSTYGIISKSNILKNKNIVYFEISRFHCTVRLWFSIPNVCDRLELTSQHHMCTYALINGTNPKKSFCSQKSKRFSFLFFLCSLLWVIEFASHAAPQHQKLVFHFVICSLPRIYSFIMSIGLQLLLIEFAFFSASRHELFGCSRSALTSSLSFLFHLRVRSWLHGRHFFSLANCIFTGKAFCRRLVPFVRDQTSS